MNEIVTKELTNEEILDNKLKERLHFWGVPKDFKVDDEVKGVVLSALSDDDILSVYIDEENGLCISYSGDGFVDDGNADFIPNQSV